MYTTYTPLTDIRHLTFICKMPADFANVEELLQGMDTEQRSLYFTAGYTAYCNGRGPGRGRENALGWLAAYHDDMAELEAQATDRQHVQTLAWGLL